MVDNANTEVRIVERHKRLVRALRAELSEQAGAARFTIVLDGSRVVGMVDLVDLNALARIVEAALASGTAEDREAAHGMDRIGDAHA